MKDVVHGAIRYPMGSIHAEHMAVGLHVGGNSINDVQGPLRFFHVMVTLIVGIFASVNFFQNVLNSFCCHGMSPNFGCTFSSSNTDCNEIAHFPHCFATAVKG